MKAGEEVWEAEDGNDGKFGVLIFFDLSLFRFQPFLTFLIFFDLFRPFSTFFDCFRPFLTFFC